MREHCLGADTLFNVFSQFDILRSHSVLQTPWCADDRPVYPSLISLLCFYHQLNADVYPINVLFAGKSPNNIVQSQGY